MPRKLFYVTNRGHEGRDPLAPRRYGPTFSDGGAENLRFGEITLGTRAGELAPLAEGVGRGESDDLQAYLERKLKRARIRAFREKADPSLPETAQEGAVRGSTQFFEKLRALMSRDRDVLVFVHGYDVSWEDAVLSAFRLQETLNRASLRDGGRFLQLVLFTWPSDGKMLPWVSYRSDRTEASASGYALGRALLKLRDYLSRLSREEHCGREVHLLCHSMGSFVLESALARMDLHAGGELLPGLLGQVFLCAADVDDDAFEPGRPLSRLTEICRAAHVYYNRGDLALHISHRSKGNRDRLGSEGVARPALLHRKVRMIDASETIGGVVEHSYFLEDPVNRDIRMTLDGLPEDDPRRGRVPGADPQSWVLKREGK